MSFRLFPITRSLFQVPRWKSAAGSCAGDVISGLLLNITKQPHYNVTEKRFFQTNSAEAKILVDHTVPGSAAFADCETAAVVDLYYQFARKTGVEGECYLDPEGVRELLKSIGERPDEETLQDIFQTADLNRTGTINLEVRSFIKDYRHGYCSVDFTG